MFPAQRSDMGEEVIGDGRAESAHVLDGSVQI
jgi:hypothetical protein